MISKKKILALTFMMSLGFFLTVPSFIVVGSHEERPEMEVYLLANDVHVSLVFPLKNELVDWGDFLDLSQFEKTGEWFQLGWGDRAFYFDVPTWEDLTLSKAVKALFLPGEPVIHVDFLHDHPLNLGGRQVKVSRKKYQDLIAEVKRRFKLRDGAPETVRKGYSETDNFYSAHGTYSILRTCNNWTAELLGHVGLRRPLWSPTKYGLLLTY